MRSVRVLGKRVEKEALRLARLTGARPTRLRVSPKLYRRLLEMICRENSVGNLLIGCRPVHVVETSVGRLALVVDEMLTQMTFLIELSGDCSPQKGRT